MPSPNTSARNLMAWRSRTEMRSANETLAIKKCIWQWALLSPEHRKPTTQMELAKELAVSQAYVSKVKKRLLLDAPMDLLAGSPVTPAHVIAMRQRQEGFDRDREEDARQTAEHWVAAWHEEEARARCDGNWPERSQRGNERPEVDEDPEKAGWDRFDEEVRRAIGLPRFSKNTGR